MLRRMQTILLFILVVELFILVIHHTLQFWRITPKFLQKKDIYSNLLLNIIGGAECNVILKNQPKKFRIRRDFMYASSLQEYSSPIAAINNLFDESETIDDAQCFQNCNNKWKNDFTKQFHLNVTEFYDFPFHPKILDYSNFIAYCNLADRHTKCFIEECNDQSADRVFSPSNFLCNFKRNHFLRTRSCFEESEPITFLKCDQECHSHAVAKVNKNNLKNQKNSSPLSLLSIDEKNYLKLKENKTESNNSSISSLLSTKTTTEAETTLITLNNVSTTIIINEKARNKRAGNRASGGKVFLKSEMDNYERELDLLCTFQECYKECYEKIIKQICSSALAESALDLITHFVNWHATDIYDWHLVTQNIKKLPASCMRLAESTRQTSTTKTTIETITKQQKNK